MYGGILRSCTNNVCLATITNRQYIYLCTPPHSQVAIPQIVAKINDQAVVCYLALILNFFGKVIYRARFAMSEIFFKQQSALVHHLVRYFFKISQILCFLFLLQDSFTILIYISRPRREPSYR